MPIYECDYCNYSTTIKTHYNKHLKTQKHLNKLKELDAKLLEKMSNTKNPSLKTAKDCERLRKDCEKTAKDCENNKKIVCEYCNKTFTRQNNLTVHLKKSCKKYDEKQKIIELENKEKELKNKEKELEKKEKELEKKYKDEIEKLHQKIEFLMEQKQGPTTIINIDKQINLNSYGSEDMSHITENFKDQMLKIPFVAIPKMIEEVHFSDKKPENKNIKLTNKKENYVKVYQGDKWIFKDRKSTIKQLMDDKYTIIDNHYEEYKEEPKPKHVDSQYKKFKDMYNEGDRDLHNEIRVDCELLLLNNMEP